MATEVAAQPPAWMDGVEVTGADMRRQIVRRLADQAGVVPGGLTVAALPSPTMAVRLTPGLSFVDDEDDGLYPVRLAAQTDLDVPAAHATLPRVDSVIAQVVDNGDNTSTYKYRVVPGTAASSPVPPTLPPGDAPTAKTLRLDNISVAAAATSITNANITRVAAAAIAIPRPSTSELIAKPAVMSTTGAYVDFDPSEWPPVSGIVVGESGMLDITIGAGNMANAASQSSTLRIAYRISGTDTRSALPLDSKSVLAVGQTNSGAGNPHWGSYSRSKLITGLTPGGIVTVTPQWRISSGTAADVTLTDGELIVRPVA